ncbi:cache domain-containing protein, partial [Vibrio sp.]|uniref:cache domain-containing protein n=1 Tax=Vibrio sp. TaxID=678 RepID=UPI003D0BD656
MGRISNRKLSLNITLLSIAPMVLVVLIVAKLLFSQSESLVEEEMILSRNNIMAAKKQELKQYVELALKSIQPYYEDEQLPQEAAKKIVAEKLSQLTYGSDGYFFAYSWDGNALVLPYQPERIGKNWWQVQDVNGKLLLQELIRVAREGGGFVNYLWHKPSRAEPLPKLSYAVSLDKWQWMVGTGVYIDDVERQLTHMQVGFDANVGKSTTVLFVVVSVAVAIIAVLGASLNFSVRRLANEELQLLNQQIISSQENERQRVSRELHDGVNQLLVAAKYRLDNVFQGEKNVSQGEQNASHGEQQVTNTELQASRQAMDQAIIELRRISQDLRPPQLDDLGLVAAIDAYINELRTRSQLEYLFEHDISDVEMLPDVETTLYRVVQESLFNVEKHAHAKGVDVILQQEGSLLLLTINDDGKGIDPQQLRRFKKGQSVGFGHMGLQNMQERIEALGGQFDVSSIEGQGTEVRVSLKMEFI